MARIVIVGKKIVRETRDNKISIMGRKIYRETIAAAPAGGNSRPLLLLGVGA